MFLLSYIFKHDRLENLTKCVNVKIQNKTFSNYTFGNICTL